jgi:hypothetical protein
MLNNTIRMVGRQPARRLNIKDMDAPLIESTMITVSRVSARSGLIQSWWAPRSSIYLEGWVLQARSGRMVGKPHLTPLSSNRTSS